jgi:DNA mismatch endonuclease, patch repair protein
MSDIFSKEKRSDVMSRVRSRGNRRTELALIELLRRHKIRGWRRHSKLPGTPDFIFPSEGVAIFVDGCFWHSCPKHATFPAVRAKFWLRKLEENKARDRRVNRVLRQTGWCVLRVWQHDLVPKNAARCVCRIQKALQANAREPIHSRRPRVSMHRCQNVVKSRV